MSDGQRGSSSSFTSQAQVFGKLIEEELRNEREKADAAQRAYKECLEEIKERDVQISELQGLLGNLRGELTSKAEEVARYKEDVSRLSMTFKNDAVTRTIQMNDQWSSLGKEQAARAALEVRCAELEAAVAKQASETRLQQTEKLQLAKQVETLKEQVSKLTASMRSASEETANLRGLSSSREEELLDLLRGRDSHINELERQIKTLYGELSMSESAREEARGRLALSERQLNELKLQLDDTRLISGRRISELRQEAERGTENLGESRREAERLSGHVVTLTRRNEAATKELEELKMELMRAKKLNEVTQKEMLEVKRENNEMVSLLKRAQSEINSHSMRLKEAEAVKNDLVDKLEQQHVANEVRLTQQHEQLTKILSEGKRDTGKSINQLSAELERTRGSLTQFCDELNLVRVANAKLVAVNDAMRKETEQLKEGLKTEAQKAQRQTEELMVLRAQVSEAKTENQRIVQAKQEQDKLVEVNERLKGFIRDMREEMETVHKEVEKLKQLLEAEKTKVGAQQEEIERYKAILKDTMGQSIDLGDGKVIQIPTMIGTLTSKLRQARDEIQRLQTEQGKHQPAKSQPRQPQNQNQNQGQGLVQPPPRYQVQPQPRQYQHQYQQPQQQQQQQPPPLRQQTKSERIESNIEAIRSIRAPEISLSLPSIDLAEIDAFPSRLSTDTNLLSDIAGFSPKASDGVQQPGFNRNVKLTGYGK